MTAPITEAELAEMEARQPCIAPDGCYPGAECCYHYRADVPRLIAEMRRLREERSAMRIAVARHLRDTGDCRRNNCGRCSACELISLLKAGN